MGVTNIIDRRVRPYRFLKINAIVEATWHDNWQKNADQVPENQLPDYAEQEQVSIEEAIAWGNSFPAPVTLFLFDENRGLYKIRRRKLAEGGTEA